MGEKRNEEVDFTVSSNQLHPAARIGSTGFKPTARTATMMSSGPEMTGSGTSRNSSFEGGPKVRTPMARMSICLEVLQVLYLGGERDEFLV